MLMNPVEKMVAENNNPHAYTLVVGLGVTGLSVVKFLRARGETVVVTDSRDNPPGKVELEKNYPDVMLKTGAFEASLFSAAKQIIASPGVPLSTDEIQQAMAANIDVIGDIELFAREVAAPVIAITGSNGKSTVTTLVGEMAKKAGIHVAVGGNLGVPVLELLSPDVELYVLELSSFQLETLFSLKPVAATVLNISPDHMDRYRDLDDYAEAKKRIYEKALHIIINQDDARVKNMATDNEAVTAFSLAVPGADDYGVSSVDGQNWLCKGQKKIIAEDDLKMGGRHNVSNALAALALGEAAGIPMIAMIEALREFTGLPHRTQWVAQKNNVNWYNDSKGTNVGATLAAIEGLTEEKNIVLIAGGLAKDANFKQLKPALEQKVRCLILIGRDADRIEKDLDNIVPVYHASSMEQAVSIAAEKAEAGDVVLLSPACASFDMFNGYEHRGEVFMQAVEKLL